MKSVCTLLFLLKNKKMPETVECFSEPTILFGSNLLGDFFVEVNYAGPAQNFCCYKQLIKNISYMEVI